MSRRIKASQNKKSMLAVETLLGILISVVVLFFLLKAFFTVFLQTPTNLKIAQNNAQSIQDFIQNIYNSKNSQANCFDEMKLMNLNNYQFKEKSTINNYFYVLNQNGIYIVQLSNLDNVVQKKDFQNYITDSYCFNGKKNFGFSNLCNDFNKFDIYYDNTDQTMNVFGNGFTLNSYGLPSEITGTSLKLEKGSSDSFIILKPNLPSSNNLNNYVVEFVGSDSQSDIYGNYLAVDKLKNQLFITKGSLSNFLVANQLCSLQTIKQQPKQVVDHPQHPENINPLTNNIVFSWEGSTSNIKSPVSFKWENNVPKCYKNAGLISCNKLDSSIFSSNYKTSLTYLDFLKDVKIYYKTKDQTLGNMALVVSLIPISAQAGVTS